MPELFGYKEMTDADLKSNIGKAPIYWMHEAIIYLGLDRLGLARPDLAIHRLIRKGALHPKKISGHLAFDKKELDLIAENGDQKRERWRPKKIN